MKSQCYIYNEDKALIEIGSGSQLNSNLYIEDIAKHYRPEGINGVHFGGSKGIINSEWRNSFVSYVNRRLRNGTMRPKYCKECGTIFLFAEEQMNSIKKASSIHNNPYREPVRCESCRSHYRTLGDIIRSSTKIRELYSKGEITEDDLCKEGYFVLNYSPKRRFFTESYKSYCKHKHRWSLTWNYAYIGKKSDLDYIQRFYNLLLSNNRAKIQRCIKCHKFFLLTDFRKRKLEKLGYRPSNRCRNCD